jgi:hypothetical protein
MPHTYKWADAEHTIVGRDDGKSFAWPRHIENVANINGRIAEEYRVEGSPKISPYNTSKPVAATRPRQQTKPPAIPTVADAEAVLATLEQDRRQLVSARAADDAEMSKHAYAARVQHELEASRSLSEIGERARERDQQLREIDCAVFEARERLAAAERAEVAAADRLRAEAASKLAHEFAATFSYADKHFRAAIDALIAIDHEIAKLHELGCAFPSHQQLRLGVVTAITTELQRLPRTWFNELAGGLRYLAPNQRRSLAQYWAVIEASINNQINQRLDKTEQPKQKERAA